MNQQRSPREIEEMQASLHIISVPEVRADDAPASQTEEVLRETPHQASSGHICSQCGAAGSGVLSSYYVCSQCGHRELCSDNLSAIVARWRTKDGLDDEEIRSRLVPAGHPQEKIEEALAA